MYKTNEELPLYRWNIFDHYSKKINTAITTRNKGYSDSPYKSLNMGLHCGDKEFHVIENRKKLCLNEQINFRNYTCAQQTHSANIQLVSTAMAGMGRENYSKSIKNTDALIIDKTNIMINIFLADCVPLVIYDYEKNIGALIHAGWRGTAQLITQKTINSMVDQCNCKRETMIAGIGPSIGKCCFQITDDTAEKIRNSFPYSEKVILKNEKSNFADLKLANFEQLLKAGIKKTAIEKSAICTACNNKEFFSYRADSGQTGRFSTYLVLK